MINNNEYDRIPIPFDIDSAIERGVSKAAHQKAHLKNKNIKIKKVTGIMAASLALIISTICITQPALAAKIPLIGNVFKLIENSLLSPGNYSDYATAVNEKVTSRGVSMTLSEILCDGSSLYVTYVIESEKAFSYTKSTPNYTEDLVQLTPDEIYNKVDFTDNQLNSNGMGLMGRYVDEHTFIGVAKYSFDSLNTEIPDNFTFEVKFNSIHDYSFFDSDENLSIKGTWGFKVPVTVNYDLKTTLNIENAQNNFAKVNTITKTPFEMILDIDFNDETWSDNCAFKFYDDNNNILLQDSYGPDNDNPLKGIFTFEGVSKDISSIRIVIDKQTYTETNKIVNEDGSSESDVEVTSGETVFDKTINLK